MKYNTSLEIKITALFLFTFILLCFSLFFIDKSQMFSDHKKVTAHYKTLAIFIKKNRMHHFEVIEYLNDNGFEEVEDPFYVFDNIKEPLLKQRGFEVLSLDDKYYLHIIAPHFRILFEDKVNTVEKEYLHFFAFGVITLLLCFVYYLILKNIKDTRLLLNSRQLFLRTVMHELKTPIAKGRIVSEMLDDEKQKSRLVSIFEKLNFLINDFAKVEQVVSKNYQTTFSNYTTESIIKSSIDMLMLDDTSNIEIKGLSDEKISVDIELFSLAIKNLLDNGLKYSLDKKVIIKQKGKRFEFISNGEKLPKPLDEYFKPFHNDTSSKNHGMGLGLYIVDSILKLHKMRLEYSYKNDQNIFIINFESL